MKENDNVCPCCRQKIPESEINHYLFREQWFAAFNEETSKKGICVEGWDAHRLHVYDEIPPSMRDWGVKNPMPKINHINFTVQLAQRVERLESLLMEKGGAE